jgi:N-acetylmuramoyl-L-alanine amidase
MRKNHHISNDFFIESLSKLRNMSAVLNLRKTAALLLAFVALTGCPTPPKPPPKITPIQIQGTSTKPLITEKGTNQPPAPAPIQPPTGSPIPINTLSNLPAYIPTRQTWVPLASWGDPRGYGKLRELKNNPHLAYEMRSPAGAITIALGSRVAFWNGLNLGLGFEPRFTNGQPAVHSLDIIKNFAPLAAMPPLLQKSPRIVVIDPGHGGEIPGTKSVVNDRFEKHYTLDWALRVQPLLIAKGWKVFLTRTNDIDVSLVERVAFADKVRADLFISLHFNSVDQASTRFEPNGLETYCLTPTGMPSNLTRYGEDDRSLVYPNNAFDAQNLQYAFRLHQALLQFTGRKDRGIRRARFMTVLQGQKRPAVLLEGGYLTNPEEARLIATASHRQKLAQAVAAALSE